MASVVNICNLALGGLGEDATVTAISPPDGSQNASYCQQFYPIARDMFLEMHNWRFASKRMPLAQLNTTEIPAEWVYAYAIPSTCIKVRAIRFQDQVVSASSRTIFDQNEFESIPDAQPFIEECLQTGDSVIY